MTMIIAREFRACRQRAGYASLQNFIKQSHATCPISENTLITLFSIAEPRIDALIKSIDAS